MNESQAAKSFLLADFEEPKFERFCGSELWDSTLSWNTQNDTLPDFTKCFQQTLASWIPCGFLWFCFPFYLYYLSTRKVEYKQKLSTLSATKTIISLMLAALSLFELGYTVAVKYYNKETDSYKYLPSSAYVSTSLEFVTMLAAAVLVQSYRLSGQFSSGVLWCYWGLWTLGSLVPFYSEIVHFVNVNSIDDIPEFVIKTVYFSLCLLQFVLSCISDANQETKERFKNVCPEVVCSFSSFLTYDWLSPLISLGYKRELEKEDLWELGPDNTHNGHVPAFEADWNVAVAKWRHQKANNERYTSLAVNEDSSEPLIEPTRTRKEPKLSLTKIIIKHYGGAVLAGFACKFAYDWIQFAGPLLQNDLMSFVSSRTDEHIPGTPVDPVWQGYFLAFLLLASQLVMTVLLQMQWYLSLQAGMRTRASVTAIIYKKALRMTSEAKQESTVGEIVNLMAVDAQRLQDVFQYIWMLWSGPLQIGIALWQLYLTVGAVLFVGFGLMVATIPVNGLIAIYQKKVQAEQMKIKDERIRVMNEVLGGIKVIKLYAWEPSFEERVAALRAREMKTIAASWKCIVAQYSTFASIPVVVAAATYATYVCVQPDHILTPTVAFITLSLFNILRTPLYQLPAGISYTVMANVSLNRIVEFFKTLDLADDNVDKDDSCDVSLKVTGGTFSWLPDTTKILRNVNLEVPTGSLTAIVGQVGCGKSSLLAACVGDMHKHSGKVVSKGATAFVAQQAWIQNATVQENILFGQDFDREKYDRIVEAVALKPDFKILDYGDQTMIGEKGINLSGGQKQRVSLARACYSNADVFLLDDPLSAVDAHVGKHIFDHAIGPNGLLKDKTRVLVTHGIQWLPMVDNIAVMSNSTITEFGTYTGLIAQKGPFAQFVDAYAMTDAVRHVVAEVLEPSPMTSLTPLDSQHDSSITITKSTDRELRKEDFQKQMSMSAILTMSVRHSELEGTQAVPVIREEPYNLKEMETVESGSVTADVYKLYAKAMGYLMLSLNFISLLLVTAAGIGSSVWLSSWTNDEKFLPATTSNYTADEIWATTKYYLVVYCVLAIIQCILAYVINLTFAKCSVSASAYLHQMLLNNIMKAQMMFFDTKPLGRILNRFSKDIDAIDNVLGINALAMVLNLTIVLSTIVIIIYSTPVFLLLVIPLAVLYYLVQRYFIRTARQVKRREAVTRSPVFTHFSETVTGAETIRAFAVQDRFIEKSEKLVEENVAYFFAGWAASRWLAIRLQVLSATVVGLAASLCVMSTQIEYFEQHMNSSIVGLAISYALLVTRCLDMLIRNMTDFETNVVSIERVKEYSDVPLEADWIDEDDPPPRQWPARGAIQFRRYATRYRPELDLVLKELDFSIKPQEKVGIVGRTGAGKSSMTVALFRLIEAARGSIYIDGVNIGAIGLHQLRNKITILPQDPVLFSGTMRDNLDPFHEYDDDKIWEVLKQSFLKNYIESQPEKLEYDCGEGGENLSVGQRQLVCLARALLRKTKILVLDEATAAVDLETDDLIQQTIRKEFADCTILTIAHRLNTIMDSDRILVLDKGKVAEFDTPENLLENYESIFSGMAKEAGIKAK